MSPGIGGAHRDAVVPATAEGGKKGSIGRCSTVGEGGDRKELRVGTKALGIFDAEAAVSGRINLVDGQLDRQMHTVISLVVNICDPVMTKVLLHAKLPLLQIGKNRFLRQLGGAERGVGEAGGDEGFTVGAYVGTVGGNALIQLIGGGDSWIRALEAYVDCRSRSESGSTEANAGKLIDSVSAADNAVLEKLVVESDARQNTGVDIRNQAGGGSIVARELNSPREPCRGVGDAGAKVY